MLNLQIPAPSITKGMDSCPGPAAPGAWSSSAPVQPGGSARRDTAHSPRWTCDFREGRQKEPRAKGTTITASQQGQRQQRARIAQPNPSGQPGAEPEGPSARAAPWRPRSLAAAGNARGPWGSRGGAGVQWGGCEGGRPRAHCRRRWLPWRDAEGRDEHLPHHYPDIKRARKDRGASCKPRIPAVPPHPSSNPPPLHPPALRPAPPSSPSCRFPHPGVGSALLLRPPCTALCGYKQLPPAEQSWKSHSGATEFLASRGKCQSLCKGATVHRAKRNRSSSADQDPPWKWDIGSRRTIVLSLCVPFLAGTPHLAPPPPAPGTSCPINQH